MNTCITNYNSVMLAYESEIGHWPLLLFITFETCLSCEGYIHSLWFSMDTPPLDFNSPWKVWRQIICQSVMLIGYLLLCVSWDDRWGNVRVWLLPNHSTVWHWQPEPTQSIIMGWFGKQGLCIYLFYSEIADNLQYYHNNIKG